jgi:hypothetical protein
MIQTAVSHANIGIDSDLISSTNYEEEAASQHARLLVHFSIRREHHPTVEVA